MKKMNPRIRVVVFLLSVALTGMIGFYLGLRKGAETIGALASQNEISNALNSIDSSLMALEKNDLTYSQQQHQRDFYSALFNLGVYTKGVRYWKCKERDRIIILNARNYLITHPAINQLPPKPLLRNALQFCQSHE